jgi:raffinose/stachyose/melibiose transport system permease protein
MSEPMEMSAAPAVPSPQVKHRRRKDRGRVLFIALMLLPALALLGLFMYYPIVETFRLSFMRTSGLDDAVFTGLGNFRYLFSNDEFLAGLAHGFLWAFWSPVIQLPLAFFVAYSLILYRNRATRSLRAIYYLANILPTTITAMLGIFIFSNTNGVLAAFARWIGWTWLAKIDFLGNPSIAFWSVFFVATWMYTGFPIIYLMARMEQIPEEIREAAQLDGAGGWHYARSIVLPMVSYPLRVLAVLMIVGSLKLFDLPFLMTKGGPGDATKTLGIILYNQGFVNWQYGSASAVGVVIFLLSLVFTIVQFSWQRRAGDAE